MQNYLAAIIQGIGEFLPISSSGHLLFFEKFFDFPATPLPYKVALHFGSLIALILFYLSDIYEMFMGAVERNFIGKYNRKNNSWTTKAWTILLASTPIVIVGYFITHYNARPQETLLLFAITSIVFGMLLFVCDYYTHQQKSLRISHGIFVGLLQCLAIVPGVSRLGICLTASRMLGLNRKEAVWLSMVMAIPSLLGACVLMLVKDSATIAVLQEVATIKAIALTTVVGLITIKLAVHLIEKYGSWYFGIYRAILGISILLYLYG